jgi:hypothetical protein
MNRIAWGPVIGDLENNRTDLQHLISHCKGRTRVDENVREHSVGK